MSTLGERIKQLRGADTQEAFAAKIGISKGALGGYERDENSPSAAVVLKICAGTNISVSWLLLGAGSMSPEPHTQHVDGNAVLLPMVEAVLSAGSGSFATDVGSERRYAFRRDLLCRMGNPAHMVLMRVDGDSMEPTIKNGDVVLIDQSQLCLLPGKLYAVGVEDMVFIKIVTALPGKIVLRSLNDFYPALEVGMHDDLQKSVRIVGRCVWFCREL